MKSMEQRVAELTRRVNELTASVRRMNPGRVVARSSIPQSAPSRPGARVVAGDYTPLQPFGDVGTSSLSSTDRAVLADGGAAVLDIGAGYAWIAVQGVDSDGDHYADIYSEPGFGGGLSSVGVHSATAAGSMHSSDADVQITTKVGSGPIAGTFVDSTHAYVVLGEGSDPSGTANAAQLFARDNGAGKTQLCVKFPSGAVQVIATEP